MNVDAYVNQRMGLDERWGDEFEAIDLFATQKNYAMQMIVIV